MIITKRTKRKHVLFTPTQWERVCERAKYLKMKPATYLRKMSLHKEWKNIKADDFCSQMRIINHVGYDLNMIIKVAEETNSEYLERLREFKKDYEESRKICIHYFSQLMNRW